MQIQIQYRDKAYNCDLSEPLDISIPVGKVNCFYAPNYFQEPYVSGSFIGSVKEGSPVNFYNVFFNPHGHGTHTESLGHITRKQEPINTCLKQFHFIAELISVELSQLENDDIVITAASLEEVCPKDTPDALIIRSTPNLDDKLHYEYSGSNPPYLTKGAMEFIVSKGVKHLLIDQPSVDREEDEGKLENHKIFWNVEDYKARKSSKIDHTITELIFIPDEIEDGLYLLNLQVSSFELDAAPSKPVLYKLSSQNQVEKENE